MNLFINIFFQSIYASMTAIGFAFMFNSPRKIIIPTCFTGMAGWSVYSIVTIFNPPFIIPAFLGSFTVSIISELLARKQKHPAIIYTMPAIIPFVPGYSVYYTMYYIINENIDMAIRTGAEAIFITIAIACGIMITSSIFGKTRINFKLTLKNNKSS